MKVLGLIPARGGSKGIPNKNLTEVEGKPLVAHAIEFGLSCCSFMDTFVTTESAEIASIAEQLSVEVIPRPQSMATDQSMVVDAVRHAVELLQQQGRDYDFIALIQPTAPLRTKRDLENILEMFRSDPTTNCVVSVIQVVDSHPARMYQIDETSSLIACRPDDETKRRQDLEPLYLRNGCFYVVRMETFLRENSLMPQQKKAYVMDARWACNLDTPVDLDLLRIMLPQFQAEFGNAGR